MILSKKDLAIYMLIAFSICLILVPIIKRIGLLIGAYAKENHRTVHKGKIVRIGGLAIYLSFVITLALAIKADRSINAILIGSLVIFLTGLLDDLFDIPAKFKLLGQALAAFITLSLALSSFTNFSFLSFINYPIIVNAIGFMISMIWLVGIMNAINLIDGLDGLALGVSNIILISISILAYFIGRYDIILIAGILIAANSAMLIFNFNPASIFLGDCGALFIGYMIASLSLIGFKQSTLITIFLLVLILFIPIIDTATSIIRRKLAGKRVSEADKNHLHHILMFKIGLNHRNTVILIYFIAIIFALASIFTYQRPKLGYFIILILLLVMWLFIELTGMINPRFHPIIGLIRRIFKHPKKSEKAFFEANRIRSDYNYEYEDFFMYKLSLDNSVFNNKAVLSKLSKFLNNYDGELYLINDPLNLKLDLNSLKELKNLIIVDLKDLDPIILDCYKELKEEQYLFMYGKR